MRRLINTGLFILLTDNPIEPGWHRISALIQDRSQKTTAHAVNQFSAAQNLLTASAACLNHEYNSVGVRSISKKIRG